MCSNVQFGLGQDIYTQRFGFSTSINASGLWCLHEHIYLRKTE